MIVVEIIYFYPLFSAKGVIMKTILIICVVIVIIVLLLSVLTTSKAYQYKHTVDPVKKLDDLPGNETESEKEK